jgi:hypothetical protein
MVARRKRIPYDNPFIAAFARHFGQPDLHLTINEETGMIVGVEVVRDAVCGCAHHVAKGLVDVSVDDAEQEAGLLHHHYPCLASMIKDIDFGDTLMHISGNLLKDNVGKQVKPFKAVQYIIPGVKSD